MEPTFKQTSLSFLVTIVNRDYGDDFTDFYRTHGIFFNLTAIARGTAPTELLDYLGLGETLKEVVFSSLPSKKVSTLFHLLEEKMQLSKPGRGIAFTVPVNTITGKDQLNYMMGSEPVLEEKKMDMQSNYELVLAVIDRGFSDPVMAAAREAGATGGTIIHARGAGIDEAEKFFGISIQPEKEMVLILVPRSHKKAVMQNIYNQCDLSLPGKGLCFSLPVGEVLGLASDNI